MIRQGDVVITLFPYSNLSTSKMRPALVVSNDSVNASGDFIAVAISSALREFHTLPIRGNDFEIGGLNYESYVHCDKIYRIDGARYQGTVGYISSDLFKKVIQKINEYLKKN